MNVSVFGLGYVGCVTAGCLAARGHHVVGVDLSPEKVAMVNAGNSPIVEPGLGELLSRTRHAYDHGLLELHFYAAVPQDASLAPRPPFRWAKRAKLASLQFPPANAAVLAALCAPAQA